ncbi:Ocs element-binding factor 1 [Spatholobus suberectus]|nr:Ocs element-binding factor 1 [Spatholobus suberectus]
MASSSGTTSMSTKFIHSSGSEEDLRVLMEQRKKKRKQSNRESAKRSRMRKQKHLDDLIAQVERLKRENSLILTKVNITTLHYHKVEAENCILRAQKCELTQSLQSLNDIIDLVNTTTGLYQTDSYLSSADHNNNNYYYNYNNFMNPMHMAYVNQPIVAAADMFHW